MMIVMNKYQYCKKRMVAYLNGELSAASRRRVARYIDESPRCYALYLQQRRLCEQLRAELPRFGRPTDRQLDRVWIGIQAELFGVRRRHPLVIESARYGLATIAVVLMLIIPTMFGQGEFRSPVTLPATPAIAEIRSATITYAPGATPVAFVTSISTTEMYTLIPQAAPQGTPGSE